MAPSIRLRCCRSVVLCSSAVMVSNKRPVAELGGGREHRTHHVGVDALAGLQPLGGEAAGLVAERRVVAP